MRRFRNRTEAGQQLAKKLSAYANRADVLVLGLPRGGVPVAYEVAVALNLPLDICLVRKLGAPGNKELAMGAIGMGGVMVLNDDVVESLHVSPEGIARVVALEEKELERRDRAYRGNWVQLEVVDEGLLAVGQGAGMAAGRPWASCRCRSRPRSRAAPPG